MAGVYLLFPIPRLDFKSIFLIFSVLFGLMLFFYKSVSDSSFQYWWWFLGGFFLRLILLFSTPTWSDDYARFLWDGEMVGLAENPYLETPNEWMVSNPELESPYLNSLLDAMNSPDYFSVYPPINQLLFWLGSLGGESNLKGAIVTLRAILLLGEILVFWLLLGLLKKHQKKIKLVILYWFNPLVIFEITGNLHFEGLVLMALLFALWFLSKEHAGAFGGFWSLAVGIKILPLMLIPSIIFNEKIRKSKRFWLGAAFVFGLAFFPLLFQNSWQNLLESLRLYQGKFEFNASVYFLLREVGYWIKGYNMIATLTKILSVITFIGIVWISWRKRWESTVQLAELWVLVYLLYLMLQPVVHPWYLIPVLGLSMLTRIRSVLVWSFTVILSYHAYSQPEYSESPMLLWIEYSLVAIALAWDWKNGALPLKTKKI
ncbi:DUF2029 domain-containing protein [Algoriphagus aestuarii]|nr:DUF2029 domain-containing protein [Algoriphagus aestuarii]